MRWPAALYIFLIMVMLAGTADAAGHFNITYETGPLHSKEDTGLQDVLEKAYDDVDRSFRTCPGHIEVVVISDRAMDKVGKQVDSFSGWNKEFSAIVLRNSALKNSSSLPVVARHELAHLAVNEILCKKDPANFRWMEEGVCTLVSKEPLGDAEVSDYIIGHGFLDIGEVYDAIKSEDCAVSKNGYLQSYSLVRYMEGRYGLDTIKKLLECPEESLDAAFRRCAGVSFTSFYGDWKAHVMTSGRAST